MCKQKITEPNLINFLEVLLKVERSISLQEFIKRVSIAFELTPEDLEPSNSRPNEAKYEQRCRNINCHRSFPKDKISYENQIFKSIK